MSRTKHSGCRCGECETCRARSFVLTSLQRHVDGVRRRLSPDAPRSEPTTTVPPGAETTTDDAGNVLAWWRPLTPAQLAEPPGTGGWAPAGMPLDLSPAIHRCLDEAEQHAKAGRWIDAKRTLEAAEQAAARSGPTIRHNLTRKHAHLYVAQRDRLVRLGTTAAKKVKQRKAARRARPYVARARALRKVHPEWSLRSIINEIRRREMDPPSERQIRRWLEKHGVK